MPLLAHIAGIPLTRSSAVDEHDPDEAASPTAMIV